MEKIYAKGITTFVTCEPILDFDIDEMVSLVLRCHPEQVNIGRNSWSEVSVPEPTNEKVAELISRLEPHTNIKLKKNIWNYDKESVKRSSIAISPSLF